MFFKALKNNLSGTVASTGAIIMAFLFDHGSRAQSIALIGYGFAYLVGLFARYR